MIRYRYLQFESMCEHEFAIYGGQFVRSLFSERLFQPCQIEESNQAVIADDDNNFPQDVEDDGVAHHNDEDDDDDDDNNNDDNNDDHSASADDNTLSALQPRKRQGSDKGSSSKKPRVERVNRREIVQACATLTDLACSTKAKPEMSVAIYSSILQLQDVARGQPVYKVDRVVETALQATQ
jgi:hypothetical protein